MLRDLPYEDIQAIFDGTPGNVAVEQYPFYPLTSPGMPYPGQDFITHAMELGETEPVVFDGKGADRTLLKAGYMLQALYLRTLYEPEGFYLPVVVKKRRESVAMLPGHLWGAEAAGPMRPNWPDGKEHPVIMIVGKQPMLADFTMKRNLSSEGGEYLRETLSELGMSDEDIDRIYVTNLVRWANPDGAGNKLPEAWIRDCLPLLHEEFRLVRPDFVVCLGAEPTKVICGSENDMSSMIGRAVEIEVPIHDTGEEPHYHKMTAVSIVHPTRVIKDTTQHADYVRGLKNLMKLLRGEELTKPTTDVYIQSIYTLRALREYVDNVLATPGLKVVAVDLEWEGSYPGQRGSYVRTIQLAHHGKHAGVVILRDVDGNEAFQPGVAYAVTELNRIFRRTDVQFVGHFFANDLAWADSIGLSIEQCLRVPDNLEDFRGGDYPGVFCTEIGIHAFDETAQFDLAQLGVRFCGAHRWDTTMERWKAGRCAELRIKLKDLTGYGKCPDEIIVPYGGYDAIYQRQLRDVICDQVSSDVYGNDCWEQFHMKMRAFPAFVEMHMTGVKVDMKRIDQLTDMYLEVRATKLRDLRAAISWPSPDTVLPSNPAARKSALFNPRSSQHCKEFLYGEQFSGRMDGVTGQPIRIRPPGALSLGLTPIKASGNKGKAWAKLMQSGEAHKFQPSTDKEVLGIHGMENKLALQLRDMRIIDHVIKSVLRPPKKEHGEYVIVDGHRVYTGGLASFMLEDDRVHSFFSQVKDTGRAASARPPLQNISKKRETDYARICGDQYKWVIRSALVSNTNPEDGEQTVMVAADFAGAELLMIAVLARDEKMIDHCLRAALPDGDPMQYDIHSNIAVLAFRLDCPPTKDGLDKIGKLYMRICAKNIIFGIGYGRAAEACARQAQEEGILISVADAQAVIDAIYRQYPGIPVLQEQLRTRAHDPGWVANAFGRKRRCIATSDRGAMGELERKFLNFPFQSGVADAIDIALWRLYTHPRKEELGYKIVLQIHDELLLEVPTRSLSEVYDKIIPECMEQAVTFYATTLDGKPLKDSPAYHFSIDRKAFTRWGEKLTWDECDLLGIERRFGKKPKENKPATAAA